MNAKDLAKLIRLTVREELKEQLSQLEDRLVEHLLTEQKLPRTQPKKLKKSRLMEGGNISAVMTNKRPPPRPEVDEWDSGNPLIDMVMTRTAINPEMGSIDMDEYGNVLSENMGMGSVGITANTPGVDDHMKKVLTRDYSALVKKMMKGK